jgi:hypothetical protein
VGRKHSTSASSPPHFGPKSIQKMGILTEISLSFLTLAGCATGGETLRLSGHTELVPEDARRVEGVLAAASPFGVPLPTSDLHSVSVHFRPFPFFFRGMCAYYSISLARIAIV